MARFAPVGSRAHFADAEREVLEFWQKNDIFSRSLAQRSEAPAYVFYEGPPTANGVPGIHHILARAYKDLFPRYQQMTGHSVARKAGWDTHGLPVELEIERSLGISGKQQIEDYGVAAFNALCRESVGRYIDDWRRTTERLGFWLDMDHPYRTYDGSYIESVWWSLKQLFDRDLLYQGYRVTPYCPRCQTSLSSHELSLGYREDTPDPSVFVKFRLTGGDLPTYLLVWTTTPWTLPGNVAAAVHPSEMYVRIRQGGEELILARARLEILEGDYEIVAEISGQELVALRYEPLFTDLPPEGDAFVVLAAPDLVSMAEGTGVVHIAGAYGVDDLELCRRNGIAIRHVVGLDGRFVDGQTRYRGLFVKDADARIIDDLREQGNLYRSATIVHTYPFCWRCETPLLYYALNSWFIRTTAIRDRLLENNRSVRWHPEHIRDGRMGRWLEGLVDWNLSRTRYWGTPLPIWICGECESQRCVGSAEELGMTAADDLHKPHIDQVTFPCDRCGGVMKRVPDVIDAWYDSGAMPFAQWHYPFENLELFEQRHPADFICEAMDQTRGWFFSLLAISTLLFDAPAYRNVVCLGLVLDKNGKKMSKSRRNAIDPGAIFDEFGADATRWYFYSAVSAGAEYRIGRELVEDVVRRFMLTLWNTYSFFVMYALVDDFDPATPAPDIAARPALDRWCLARLAETVGSVRGSLDLYDANAACRALETFTEDLSKWYVRRSRRRFWKGSDGEADKLCGYATLYTALETVSRLIAPFMPFLSERMYRNLHGFDGDGPPPAGGQESVHMSDFPTVDPAAQDQVILTDMTRLRRLVEEGLAAREAAKLKVRQPVASATIAGAPFAPEMEAILAEELNVKRVGYAPSAGDHESIALDTELTDELRLEGIVRELNHKVNGLRKRAGYAVEDRIEVLMIDAGGDIRRAVEAQRDHVMAETLATSIEFVREFGRGQCDAEWAGSIAGEQCWLGVRR